MTTIFNSSKISDAEAYLSNHTVVEGFAEAPEWWSLTHFCLRYIDIGELQEVWATVNQPISLLLKITAYTQKTRTMWYNADPTQQ